MDKIDILRIIESSGYSVDSIGSRRLASLIGCGKTKASKLLNSVRGSVDGGSVGVADMQCGEWTKEILGDGSLKITVPKGRTHTKEQLLEFFNINENEYIVKSIVINKWEVAAKDLGGALNVEPLYQVKATLVPVNGWNLAMVREEVNRIVESAKSDIRLFNINKKLPSRSTGDKALEISIAC